MRPARQRFDRLPPAVRGALLMTGTACAFAVMAILIRLASERIHAFDFIRLPAVALMAWLLFCETVGAWTWAGASMIFAATVYIVQREARLQILDEAERAALAERAR